LEVDGRLDLDQVDRGLCQRLQRLAPFGCGNPEPVFIASEVDVKNVQAVGRNHLGLDLSDGTAARPAIGFGMLEDRPRCGQRIDVAFVPEIDEYRDRVRLRLVDLWARDETKQEK
jgi:single-stranded-DNA-specific exonuclease